MASNTSTPTVVSDVVQDNNNVEKKEVGVGLVPDAQVGDPAKESGTVYHKASDSVLHNLASLETQPTLQYNSTLPHTQSIDYPYELDKKSTYTPLYTVPYSYENDQYSHVPVDNANLVKAPQLDPQTSQNLNIVNPTPEDAEKFQPDLQDTKLTPQVDPVNTYLNPVYCPDALVKPQNKVVAVNPVILVDKVERSLIVQWYENSVKREQRISYKKYGNAKAQQRAEGLISKLLAGSTFDQLYPEKGPPILTIFENVGKYMVSLTRDRIIREWRVDWLNNNGSKMRARWSCKKVGNEEARKRAEAFAYSLIQGTFNPRLLHKATGTRLSKNDMKYNAVVSGLDSQIESKAINQLNESNWQGVELPTKRRAKKRSVRGTDQKKGKPRKRGLSSYADLNAANPLGASGLGAGLLNTATMAGSSLGAAGLPGSLANPLGSNPSGTGDISQYLKTHCYPFMNMVQDPSLMANSTSYYPMFQEECETTASVNPQMDPNAAYTNPMLQQGWMDWANGAGMQKMMPYGQEWDYSANPSMVDYPYFPQQAGANMAAANASVPANMSWDPMNAYSNMYVHQNELATGREFEEQPDSRLNSQFYGFYGHDQQYGFQDNMLGQDQLLMGGYFNYPNTLMDSNSQWSDEKVFNKFGKEFSVDYNAEFPEEAKQEELQSDKDASQVTTLASYKNITGSAVPSGELPPQNLSVSTRMYTTDHYGYINSELGDVKHEDPPVGCFSGELEDPLMPSQPLSSQLSQPLSVGGVDYPMFPKDKFGESYDNVTYREMGDTVKFYNM